MGRLLTSLLFNDQIIDLGEFKERFSLWRVIGSGWAGSKRSSIKWSKVDLIRSPLVRIGNPRVARESLNLDKKVFGTELSGVEIGFRNDDERYFWPLSGSDNDECCRIVRSNFIWIANNGGWHGLSDTGQLNDNKSEWVLAKSSGHISFGLAFSIADDLFNIDGKFVQ